MTPMYLAKVPRALAALAAVAVATLAACAGSPSPTDVPAPGARAEIVYSVNGWAGGHNYRDVTRIDSATARYDLLLCHGEGIGAPCTPTPNRSGEVLASAFDRLFDDAVTPAFRALSPSYHLASSVVPPDPASFELQVTANSRRRTVVWQAGAPIPEVLQSYICMLQAARGDLLLCD